MSPEGVGESDGPDFLAAPAGLVRPVRVQAPLWGPSLDSPPGEYQTVNFLRLEDSQPRVTGWVGIGSGDTLAGRVELIAVEGADEPPFTYSASGGRTQIRAQMRAVGLGDADAPALVTPDDDILPIQVFWMSLAFKRAERLVTKYQPSGNGDGRRSVACSLRRVDIACDF